MPLNNHNFEEERLWQEFKEKQSLEARQQLIIKYLPQVKYQAGRLKMVVPNFIEQEDLESYGIIGLIDAINKFDYKKGIKFKTYAAQRIRGEMIDHLRKLDWLPYSLRRDGKRLQEAVESFAQKSGRRPSIEELVTVLDISREKVSKLFQQLYSAQWVSLYGQVGDTTLLNLLEDDQKWRPENQYQRQCRERLLAESIDRLNDSEALVISLYYYEELTQNEIAEVMKLTPARVSQLHKKAIYRLRGALAKKRESLL
ncbi:MAG: FliA/WhiG family RNA polymerase sigma factor [Halanaerobiales bacterium]|nr:FliA/WhiG family RNA polymerase sigma factor [Halanaerobiales bacterium]